MFMFIFICFLWALLGVLVLATAFFIACCIWLLLTGVGPDVQSIADDRSGKT